MTIIGRTLTENTAIASAASVLKAHIFASLFLAGVAAESALASQAIPDQYPSSLLYSKPVEVIPHVWTAIGQPA